MTTQAAVIMMPRLEADLREAERRENFIRCIEEEVVQGTTVVVGIVASEEIFNDLRSGFVDDWVVSGVDSITGLLTGEHRMPVRTADQAALIVEFIERGLINIQEKEIEYL